MIVAAVSKAAKLLLSIPSTAAPVLSFPPTITLVPKLWKAVIVAGAVRFKGPANVSLPTSLPPTLALKIRLDTFVRLNQELNVKKPDYLYILGLNLNFNL